MLSQGAYQSPWLIFCDLISTSEVEMTHLISTSEVGNNIGGEQQRSILWYSILKAYISTSEVENSTGR